jgi:hypothetical protein
MNYQTAYLASFDEPLESLDVDKYLDDVIVDGDDFEDEII